MLGLFKNMNLTPDMAVAIVSQMGITEPKALELVAAIAAGGFANPKLEAIDLSPGVDVTMPTEGTALVIRAQNPAERVTVLITREPLGTNALDNRESP